MAIFYQAKDSGSQRNNLVQVGLHVVWKTQQRMPMVRSDMEEAMYRCITSEAEGMGASVIAVNGMPDHVHVLLLLPTTVTIAKLVQQMKGVSSSVARDLWPERTFHWAKGYGAFAVSRTHLGKVAAYIQNQKAHHEAGKLWMYLEETDLPVTTQTNA